MDKKKKLGIEIALIALLFVGLFVLEQVVPSSHILFPVLKKSAIYALVAVSMNLLNGLPACSLWARRASC